MKTAAVPMPHISLEQWRTLVAVVDAGGYAAAAKALHKSQSAVTYAVQKIESLLGVGVFAIQGRKAVLTPTGEMLYRRALALVNQAGEVERAARRLSAGWEAEIGLAVEIIFPGRLLLDCLARFGDESPHTRLEIIESVISGTPEALLTGQADLAITPRVPPGFLGTPLIRLRLVAVASPGHPLHRLGRTLTHDDLAQHRHLAVRESGSLRSRHTTTVEVEQRWTFSTLASSIAAACRGDGFAWYPEQSIGDELATGRLRPLLLHGAEERFAELYLVVADPDGAGPGVRRLARIIRDAVGATEQSASR
ncbi:LysR family transcriptional regulator [Accumulibacter sp.]|uniref:LysR family transcriptional regulator n=1 Tax=Accumulibacter sp. TaxID=2053492 RepID=UPI0025F8F0D2|nr:LysR family transcriptional regulator [Accumulibacter sp.]MCM8595763.1 LysR family transcriptional regulator [Accumulibacter sp.]MCM8626484.1 LysR family transcriptional regulator [Accumulibacter sp.]MDS4049911.1 LysR family transcriptional regulator [Accumulibacter sp.]